MECEYCSLEEMGMSQLFWKNKKILVTGHTGFKGSWLSLWLQKMNANVVGFSKDIPTEPSHFKVAQVDKEMKSIIGDIRNYEEFENVFLEFKPEIIFHLAAQSIVHNSYEEPRETFSTNVLGTVNLLDISRKTKIPKVIINVTSDKCYKNTNQKKAFIETDPLGGFDPYSTSKACSELITDSFRNAYFDSDEFTSIGLASVRAGNVIGGGDWSQYRLIPDIVKSIHGNYVLKIRNPNSTRHWQHVLDPLYGYLILAEKLWKNKKEFSSGWNFGPTYDEGKTVSWILEKFNEFSENKLKIEIDFKDFKHESDYLMLNSDKAKNMLQWKSRISTENAIRWIVDWYKEFFEQKNMRKKSLEQIDNFERMETK